MRRADTQALVHAQKGKALEGEQSQLLKMTSSSSSGFFILHKCFS